MIQRFNYLSIININGTVEKFRAISSVGRATSLHLEGHRFESCIAHQNHAVPRGRLELPIPCGN